MKVNVLLMIPILALTVRTVPLMNLVVIATAISLKLVVLLMMLKFIVIITII